MRADQEELLAANDDIGFLQLRTSRADRLDFPAFQGEPGLVALFDEVVVQRLAVLDDRHGNVFRID